MKKAWTPNFSEGVDGRGGAVPGKQACGLPGQGSGDHPGASTLAMNYHLQQWQGALLGKLRDQFGKDAVHSIRIRIG